MKIHNSFFLLQVENRKYFEEYFGTVGTNEKMRTLLNALAVCADWKTLAKNAPGTHHVEAFRTLYSILKPTLKSTHWPSADMFPHVVPRWPNETEMCLQYILLCKRVRLRWRQPQYMGVYTHVVKVRVALIPRPILLLSSLGLLFRRGKKWLPGYMDALALINSFKRASVPSRAFVHTSVPSRALCVLRSFGV